MNGIDDRALRVPFRGLDGSRLLGEQVLAIRDAVSASEARTNEEIDAAIYDKLLKIQDRQPANRGLLGDAR